MFYFDAETKGSTYREHMYGPFVAPMDCVNYVCKPISNMYTFIGALRVFINDAKNLKEIFQNTNEYLFK